MPVLLPDEWSVVSQAVRDSERWLGVAATVLLPLYPLLTPLSRSSLRFFKRSIFVIVVDFQELDQLSNYFSAVHPPLSLDSTIITKKPSPQRKRRIVVADVAEKEVGVINRVRGDEENDEGMEGEDLGIAIIDTKEAGGDEVARFPQSLPPSPSLHVSPPPLTPTHPLSPSPLPPVPHSRKLQSKATLRNPFATTILPSSSSSLQTQTTIASPVGNELIVEEEIERKIKRKLKEKTRLLRDDEKGGEVIETREEKKTTKKKKKQKNRLSGVADLSARDETIDDIFHTLMGGQTSKKKKKRKKTATEKEKIGRGVSANSQSKIFRREIDQKLETKGKRKRMRESDVMEVRSEKRRKKDRV